MSAPTSFIVRVPEGVILRDPRTGRVVSTGEEYPLDTFWLRRLEAKDVSVMEQTIEPKANSPRSPTHG